ncbi:MAG: hypothetical protein HOP28_14835 [Gemmatimonadales bacterium]|nr:hypothetical protein [Gemmatimonadales bacterium]
MELLVFGLAAAAVIALGWPRLSAAELRLALSPLLVVSVLAAVTGYAVLLFGAERWRFAGGVVGVAGLGLSRRLLGRQAAERYDDDRFPRS